MAMRTKRKACPTKSGEKKRVGLKKKKGKKKKRHLRCGGKINCEDAKAQRNTAQRVERKNNKRNSREDEKSSYRLTGK